MCYLLWKFRAMHNYTNRKWFFLLRENTEVGRKWCNPCLGPCLNGGDLSFNKVKPHISCEECRFCPGVLGPVSSTDFNWLGERTVMAEAHQARMQNEVEEMVQSLERDHIRKMQVKQSSAVTSARAPHYMSLTVSCDSASGSHVQLQRGLLQPELRLYVTGPSVHWQVSRSSGPSPGSGHCRAGKVSGDNLVRCCYCSINRHELTLPRCVFIFLSSGSSHQMHDALQRQGQGSVRLRSQGAGGSLTDGALRGQLRGRPCQPDPQHDPETQRYPGLYRTVMMDDRGLQQSLSSLSVLTHSVKTRKIRDGWRKACSSAGLVDVVNIFVWLLYEKLLFLRLMDVFKLIF